MNGIIIFALFAACVILNLPIAISLGIAATVFVMTMSVLPMDFVVQAYFNGIDSFPLLAVPFFMLAGDIMLEGGISKRLVNLGVSVLRGVPGSLGIITIVTCTIFAAISGSGPATVAAIGGIMIPIMIKNKYDKGMACAIASIGGSLGPVVPPSICFVMYGIIANVSITDLFTAGILPGLVMAVVLCVFVLIVSVKKGYKSAEIFDDMKEYLSFGKAIWDAKWALLVPVIILGGIYGGFCTPTEAAVIATDYAIIVGVFIYKDIKIRNLGRIFLRTAMTSGTCMILVSTAMAFGRLLTMEGVPTALTNTILSLSANKFILLLIINLFLLLVGMFMETMASIIILTPLLLGILIPLGVNPVHFGIIMTINLAIGQSTPPVGVSSFVAARIGGIKFEQMFKPLALAVVADFVALLLITYIPVISLWLPALVKR